MRRSHRLMWLGLIIGACLLAGCSSSADKTTTDTRAASQSGATSTVELTISAAASLTDAMKEIQQDYESQHENIKLSFNFGASGALQQQIEQGAPVDLFFSASTRNMELLLEQKLIEAEWNDTIIHNELVVIVPADKDMSIQGIEDLNSGAVQHLAIGEPRTVPAGSYAQEALTAKQLWDSLQPRIVLAKDVRQVLTYVESGNAEAGFVYRSDAEGSDKVTIALHVDPQTYTPIEYPAGVVSTSKHPEEASEFFTYLQGDEAQAIFEKYGFSPTR